MTTNLELAKKISKHVELQTVALRRADLDADFDPLEVPPEIGLSQGYRTAYVATKGSGRIDVTVDFRFGAQRFNDGVEGGKAISLEATFLLVYAIDKAIDLDPVCLEYFASINGPFNAWPYWRELVQTVTGRVGLASVVMPVFRPVEVAVSDDVSCD